MTENEAPAPSKANSRRRHQPEPPPEAVERTARIVFAAYRQMLVTVLATLIIVIVLLLVMFFGSAYLWKSDPVPSITLSVIVCGTLGAMFSAATRLYTFRDLPAAVIDTNTKRLGSVYLFAYSLLPLLIGAISAAVIYVAFLSGLIKGSLFPEFGCHIDQCNSFANLIWQYGPKASEDYAKCLIWGFIAGFAERLVPDTLLRFAAKVSDV